jgi:hypothetical protein
MNWIWRSVKVLAPAVAGFTTVYFLCVFLAATPGCNGVTVKVPDLPAVVAPAAVPKPAEPASAKPKSVDELEKELADAKKAERAAHAAVESKTQELADAVTTARQHKLYWMVGICFLAMLGCVAGAIFLRGLAKWFIYGAVACAALIVLCLSVAAILPYLPWILLGIGVLTGVVLLAWWRLDHKGLQQVAAAVEGIKGQVPGYKEHFRQFIDGDADAWLNRVRKNLGLLGKR